MFVSSIVTLPSATSSTSKQASEASQLHATQVRYDDQCAEQRATVVPCYVEIQLDQDLRNPKLYYRLDNFYVNHR